MEPNDTDANDSELPSGPDGESVEAAGFLTRVREMGQEPLFPTEDLIIPESLRNMRKAVSAIHTSPISSDHAQSLNSRRLFDACVLIAQIDFRKRGSQALERVRTERLSPIFETRITDLVRLAGIPGKNYERVYRELDQLFEMQLRWNIVGEGSDVEWEMKSHFLSSVGYGKGSKRGLIRFSMDPSILEIVLEPSNWATLSLQAMEGLGTAASYALYQNAWRYVNTNAKVTAALPVATWVELLVGQSNYVEDDPKEGKRVVRYGDFKRRILLDAIARVNEIPVLSYTLELKELKSGKRVSKLQFKFVPKTSHSLGMPLLWPAEIIKVLENIGFTSKEIEDLSQARSFEEVADSIIKLKAAETRLQTMGRTISSKKAYFNGILANVAAGASLDDIDHDRIAAEARAQEAQRADQVRQERLRETFATHAAQSFARELFLLPPEELKALLDQFEASPQAQTPAAAQLLAKGWSPNNRPALALLRSWLTATNPGRLDALLPDPQDKSFEAWLAWRVENP